MVSTVVCLITSDIDECLVDIGETRKLCGTYGTCLNTDGSYRCHCSYGFENPPGSLTACIGGQWFLEKSIFLPVFF